jgi:hypothetical protein
MESPNPKQLRGELIELHSKQLDTVEREIFGGLTTTEWREYEERRDRIQQLYDELVILKAAA